MNNLNIAYAALLHDIGKFYQRTTKISLLNSQEIASTPIHANGYHTHIHSGYTAKFFHDYLHLNDQLEKASSGHHINEVDEFDSIIRDADRIASKIDRNDENFDFEENHKKTRYQYITSRLSSIMGNIDFGQTIYDSKFKLTSIDQCMNPCRNNIEQNTIESIEEYKKLFTQFIEEIKFDNLLIGKPTPYKYHRMYSLLYKYTTLIPSSTYETNNQTVSLFDHLKLTTAIASCLSQNNCNNFYMLEFDVSGIQSFIYKITEGSKTKTNIAKSLRGRSAFVTLITNAITYTILDKFKLTQANIIFNTGGGALLLLPYLDDTEKIIHNTFNTITKELYKRFNTSLSVVYAIEKVDKFELSNFKTEKSLALKTKLEEYKLKKFYPLINNDFCVEHLEDKEICELCGQNYVKKDHKCQNCLDILNISDYYTKHDKFTILYSNLDYNNCLMDLGFIKIYFFEKIPHELINKNDFYYIDAVNHFEAGNVKLLANLVPKENNTILNFENITKTLDKSYGDEKLGVLKMDVDNLTPSQAVKLVEELKPLVVSDSVDVVYCVPAIDIVPVVEAVKGTNVQVGAENMYFEEKGAYTGEISAEMLVDAGVKYVVIGHSERRDYFKEDDVLLNKKVKKAIEAGLTPILCCGETLEQREMGVTLDWIRLQIKSDLAGVAAADVANMVIAYEPIWAIGTGKTATSDQAQEVCGAIRACVAEIYDQATADSVRIQYGGSVNAGNAAELFAKPDIDGGLVGGASLKADFGKIVNY